jgi:ABC-type proline/glycine betaine transport system ATPase subunit
VVVVMDAGGIVELGPPEQVLENPATERTRRFIARLQRKETFTDGGEI